MPYERVKPKNAFERNTAPFDATTTHRTAFQPKEVKPTERVAAHGTSIPTSAGPFQGASVYHDSFQ